MNQCEKCGKEFKYQYLLKKHKNRKKTCENVNNIKDIYDNKIKYIEEKIKEKELEIKTKTDKSLKKITKCMFCNNTQSNKANMLRHFQKYCNVKKQLLEDILKLKENKELLLNKQEIKIYNEEIKLRDEKIKTLEDKLKNSNTIINNTINNTINNNTQNNIIVINPFGKEDLSHLSIEDYKKFINGFFPGFIKYIEKVHFDDNAPQNHNICISNLRSKYLTIHDGDKWVTKMKDDILERFINKKHNQLIDKCEYLEETKQIDKKIIDNFQEFCESFNDKEAKRTTKNDVITMLYDNKEKIKMNTKLKTNTVN